MNFQTIYIRVVPADKDRGYVLLVGFDSKVVQSTCANYTTLGGITRPILDAAIERMKVEYKASTVKDVTAPTLQRKLQKMFGEEVTPKEKVAKVTTEAE
jgi:hypothetical protein